MVLVLALLVAVASAVALPKVLTRSIGAVAPAVAHDAAPVGDLAVAARDCGDSGDSSDSDDDDDKGDDSDNSDDSDDDDDSDDSDDSDDDNDRR